MALTMDGMGSWGCVCTDPDWLFRGRGDYSASMELGAAGRPAAGGVDEGNTEVFSKVRKVIVFSFAPSSCHFVWPSRKRMRMSFEMVEDVHGRHIM